MSHARLLTLIALCAAVVAMPMSAAAQEKDSEREIAAQMVRMRSDDAGRRYSAVITLGHLAPLPEPALDALRSALGDPEDYVRVAVIQNLRNLKDLESIPMLIDRLADEDYFVRVAARGALRNLTGTKQGYDPDASPAARAVGAATWQAWWNENRARLLPGRPSGRKPTKPSEAEVEIKAIEGRINNLFASLDTYLAASDPVHRISAIDLIQRHQLRAFVPKVIDRLQDRDAFVRQAAATALRRLTSENFGFDMKSTMEERRRVADLWRAWWRTQKAKK